MDFLNTPFTLSDVDRLLRALQTARPHDPQVVRAILERVPENPNLPFGRTNLADLVRLLEQTNGSTVLLEPPVPPPVPAIQPTHELIIDGSAPPTRYHRCRVDRHLLIPLTPWRSQMIRLHFINDQIIGRYVSGTGIARELIDGECSVLNGNFLDFLLKQPDLIPEDWKQYAGVVFWGTSYTYHGFDDNVNQVPMLCWKKVHWWSKEKRWCVELRSIYKEYDQSYPAAVFATPQQ